jgi:hypothetical protein
MKSRTFLGNRVSSKFAMALATILTVGVCVSAATLVRANELRPETLQSWDNYIRTANAQINSRFDGRRSFLWLDEKPDLAKLLRQGQAVVSPASDENPTSVAHGLIHHWIGAVFVPDVKLGDVLDLLTDYDRYKDFYKPMVADSKALERRGPNRKFTLLMMQKAFSVTAAIDTENEARVVRLSSRRAYIVSHATRVQEIANFGESAQKKLPPDQGPGYIWRLQSVIRAEERDRGVYVEIETIGLSRGIPRHMVWLIKPLTNHIPKNRMLATLEDTRKAIIEEGMTESDLARPVRGAAGPTPAR